MIQTADAADFLMCTF